MEAVAISDLGDSYYIDNQRLREKNGEYFWQLANFDTPKQSAWGIFKSAVTYEEADCELFRIKKKYALIYKETNAVGRPLQSATNTEEAWTYAPPNSVSRRF